MHIIDAGTGFVPRDRGTFFFQERVHVYPAPGECGCGRSILSLSQFWFQDEIREQLLRRKEAIVMPDGGTEPMRLGGGLSVFKLRLLECVRNDSDGRDCSQDFMW